MHGLVNRSIQHFVCDTYGFEIWEDICAEAGLEFTEFEAMMRYDRQYTPDLVAAMSRLLGRTVAGMMEDLGTYLIMNPSFPAVRRLLRFSGVTFLDFLHSLDDLPDRVRLAVPDLVLPPMTLYASASDRFHLKCKSTLPGFGHVMLGVLRAMADDYGALAVLDHVGGANDEETITITLIETDFARGREFELGVGT
ncbi:MAG: heme NO-binding domain-containing protein [Sulfitobacter sp.]|nr:heme NO-binding domain-containing protein [Sulfitobacter sp.]